MMEFSTIHIAVGTILPLILTVLLILLFRPVAMRIGLLDRPDGRKRHIGSIPLVGGLGLFCAFLISVLVMDLDFSTWAPLLVAGGLLLFVGVFDDLNELQVRQRFFAQISAILLLVAWGGISLQNLGNLLGFGAIGLGMAAVPFTVFSAVGVMNALNMSDGLDGLASGILLILLSSVSVLLSEQGYYFELRLVLAMAGGVAGFFLLNFLLRSQGHSFAFLGDSGSLFLGLLVAAWLIQYSQGPYELYRPVTALWLFAVPLIDTVSVMGRRMLRGGSPFKPDRRHIHHLLLDLGWSPRSVTLLILGMQSLLAALGLLGEFFAVAEYWMFYAFLALFLVHFQWTGKMPNRAAIGFTGVGMVKQKLAG